MHLIKLRFTWQVERLFTADHTPLHSPVTKLLAENKPVVFDSSLEPCDLHRYTRHQNYPLPVFQFLSECCDIAGVSTDNIYWITPIEKFKWKNTHYFNGTIEEYYNSRINDVEFTPTVSTHFLSLNNFPKPHRKQIVEFLERTGIANSALYSYNPKHFQSDTERSIKLDTKFGATPGTSILSELDSLPANIWQSTMFSIVTESLFHEDIIFPTEKSWKAFDKYHLPIVVSAPGVVQHLRNLGFDMFDDFIDHSYDSIHENNARMEKILSVIEHWAGVGVSDLCAIKSHLEHRLRANKQRYVELAEESIKSRDCFLASLQ